MLRRPALFQLVAASAAALGLFPGCYREYTDVSVQARFTGNMPLAVDGFRPGQTLAEVTNLLGEPRKETTSMGHRVLHWSSPKEVTITFDATGRAVEVFGTALTAGTRPIVWTGLGEADVVQILGRGQVQTHRQPKGNGVISLGYKVVGRTLTYHDRDVRLEISLTEDMVRSIRATAARGGPAAR